MASAHLAALSTRHASIEAQIHTESHRPHPDESLLARLKREKLRLKDQMQHAG
ncbi:YdcH family protein [Sandaracinobacteroides saxicola]|uniref:YdcH family protein n=1 Tax=Sandaracinobacteroides saxicola TaxID=2759707 RepID=A0A7G5IEE5_9SPHN|nr:YdcH family protein [Sandaracinobacteroides saxicola]QMW21737.1 YdcH family protein [Sandaracinobacteroides saxicola]